jgi:NADH-quinone oxidoreductase subunit L
VTGTGVFNLILWLPAVSAVLCGLCAALRVRGKLPAWITVGLLGACFALVVALYGRHAALPHPTHIEGPSWFLVEAGERPFLAGLGLYVDSLTLLWLGFVTGLGTLIALYSSEYMEGDVGSGYARYFAGISVFLFAMTALVTADNLVMLYLGWEGVGFASYWLIGYSYRRPSAVAAAKKAFVVNRIGDLGLALGIWLTWDVFGTVQYAELFEILRQGRHAQEAGGWQVSAIPYLFMFGAFGKSAQIPLYVWLPDAMEGPTPVSALIHAATMVTAGVYLLCRGYPLLALDEGAGPTVAWVGGLTALLAATIGMAQYDIKRIFAYSTVSQLGYMFMGIGLASTSAAAYHVFTHAFFKAVLFLGAGAVMHGFAGQLDLRRLSGLGRLPGWRIVSLTMLYGCACLAGVPLVTNGFWSKDAIMAEAFVHEGHGFAALGAIAVLTAFLTAYYAFRVWFRVFAGPVHHEPGEEHHAAHAGESLPESGGDPSSGSGFHPHAPRLAITFTLLAITAGAVASIWPLGARWVDGRIADSSAAGGIASHEGGGGLWGDPHEWMPLCAGAAGLAGIALAWYFHLANRRAADALRGALLAHPATRWLPLAMENKWYVDELYHAGLRLPLWRFGQLLNLLDRYVLDAGIVDGLARLPRVLGRGLQPLQNGILQSYALSMAGGVALVAMLVFFLPQLLELLNGLVGGPG